MTSSVKMLNSNSKQHKALGTEFDLLKPSNVLLVMDSRRHGEAMWCGEVLNPTTGGKRAHGVFTSLKYLETYVERFSFIPTLLRVTCVLMVKVEPVTEE